MKFVRRTFGRTYDEWFAARTPATQVQIWGLVLLGTMLIAGGVSVLVLMWSKASSNPLDGFSIVLLSMCSIPGLAMVYFGAHHIKRALVGRK